MIDIIIPIYNCLDTLPSTLKSIRKQTIKNLITIYLIDDNSTIEYKSILNEFKDLNIIYYKQTKNLGPGKARQKGIEKSKNRYIMFLDSDDLIFSENSVENMYKIIDNNLDYVVGLTHDEKRNINIYNSGDIHGKLYRRSFLEKYDIKFNDSRFHEDNYFNNLVLACSPRESKLEEIVYIYTYNKNSITNDDKEFERLEILLSNLNQLLIECKKRNCTREKVVSLLLIKIQYFNRIIDSFNNDERKTFINWLNKYNINFEKYIGNLDYKTIYNDLLNNYDY